MSKHTPGPWVIMKDSGLHVYVTQPADTPNRVPGYYAEIRRFTTDNEQVEANARLIAAAPDLLEALELADCVLRGRNMDLRVVAHKVHDALEKARGE